MADSLEDPEALVMRFRKDSGLTSAVSYAYANNALRFVRDLEAKGIGLDDVTPDLLESFLKRLARSSGQHLPLILLNRETSRSPCLISTPRQDHPWEA